MDVTQCFAEIRVRSSFSDGALYPCFSSTNKWGAVALASLEPLTKAFTSTLRFRIDARMATSALGSCALDAVVGRRAIAHRAGEAVAFELRLGVIGVPAFGVHEVRVAVRALDEPERAIADHKRVLDVKYSGAGWPPDPVQTRMPGGRTDDQGIPGIPILIAVCDELNPGTGPRIVAQAGSTSRRHGKRNQLSPVESEQSLGTYVNCVISPSGVSDMDSVLTHHLIDYPQGP